MGRRTGVAAAAAAGFLVIAGVAASTQAVSYFWWFVSVPLLLWLTYLVFHTVRRGRPDRLAVGGLVLAGLVVVGSVAFIQLTGDPYTLQPRDEELVALVKGTWRGLGLDPDAMYLGPYAYEDRDDSPSCRHLPQKDRWESQRAGVGQVDEALRLEGKARSKLSGWTIERYEGTRDSPEVLLAAHRRDVALQVTLTDYDVHVAASAGPCAVPSADWFVDSEFWRRAER